MKTGEHKGSTDRRLDDSTGLPRVNPSIVLREEFEDFVFLYDPDTGETFPLNPAGVFIWRQLDGCSSIDRIVEKMNEGFEGVPASAKAHVESFLDDLKKRRLICT
ncbi:MAG: PqqD family peptide modification chaperone [Desulfobacteraceae bacterium]|nr:MAG: PqqD family peptide modification chaperone [Desulfobacteraceae bacterium]